MNRKFQRRSLVIAVSVALAVGVAQADFGPTFELSDLDSSTGLAIQGVSASHVSGRSVSSAGDINGDGIDDIIVGAPYASTGASYAGASYVVFGSDQIIATPFNLSTLNGTNGFAINSTNEDERSGTSVSAAGDINGDGIDDLIIGAPDAGNIEPYAGASYIVFGSDKAFSSPFNLTTLNGANGFLINGINEGEISGKSVSGAGDINGDGIDDVIIGAPYASISGSYSGSSYIVFGSDQAFSSPLNLSTLNGSNGFVLNGASDDEYSGTSVSAAGDINGDGIDDVIIGAPYASPSVSYSGASYVVFGSDSAFAASINLSTLSGTNGFVINGVAEDDTSGTSVSNAGDINSDGIDDVLIGAPLADPGGGNSGASYVVFGSDQEFAASLNLSSLNGVNGLTINGVNPNDESGKSVSAAGDINGDGIADLLVGAALADPNGSGSGASYVLFGSDQAFTHPFSLSGLTGANGFVVNGIAAGDNSGFSVSASGDFNGDGVGDLFTSAPESSPNGTRSGTSFIVFGEGQDVEVIFANGFE